MLTFEEYFYLLEQQRKISNFYGDEFKALAENARYLRNNKVLKKYQKDLEHRRIVGFNIFNTIFKQTLKEKDIKVGVKKVEKNESKIKQFFKKLFGIKPKEIEGVIEALPEVASTPPEDPEEKPEIEAQGEVIETDSAECYFDEEYEEDLDEWEEEESKDKLEGQMDIEELNGGNVYEEKS